MNRELQSLQELAAAIDQFNRGESAASYNVPAEIMLKAVRNDVRTVVYDLAAQRFQGKRLQTFASWLPPRFFHPFVDRIVERLAVLEATPGIIAVSERTTLLGVLKVIRYEDAMLYDRIESILQRFEPQLAESRLIPA